MRLKNRKHYVKPVRAVGRQKPSITEKLEAYSSIAANAVAVIAGLGAFFLYLWTVHTDYVKERDPQFTDNWTSFAEGCIDCPLDSNEVVIQLNIGAENGEVSGEIYIDDPFNEKGSKTNDEKTAAELQADIIKSYTHWFMIEGELFFRSGKIRLFDYRGGKKTYFGEAEIKLKNDSLYLRTTKRAYPTIPKNIVFSRALDEVK